MTKSAGHQSDRASFEYFFETATGFKPYEWQVRVALEGLPDVLPIPTGLGKTEGAVLSWVWRKVVASFDEPLHLVYCLPMRSLVQQTVERSCRYLAAVANSGSYPCVRVHQLMGGAIDEDWVRTPDHPWVLVGTQDQLLSRALNRGYAMNRFEWPVHFGVLNQDCRWIVDEVQLMGPGLWTTAQLDWMRRKRFFAIKRCSTTWMSATVGTSFLATADRKEDGLDSFHSFDPRLEEDSNEEIQHRCAARRQIAWFAPKSRKKADPIHQQLAAEVVAHHADGALSLVVCNTVDFAQQVFQALPDFSPKILLTSRFRRCDRSAAERQLTDFETRRSRATRDDRVPNGRIQGNPGLICVSTQVVEAGVDISAHRLWSELAPWPSIVQRLGRLNRDGRDNPSVKSDGACAFFWKTPKNSARKSNGDEYLGPYRKNEIDDAAKLLSALIGPSLKETFADALSALETTQGETLREALEPRPCPLPRALDVHGLFSTERDAHGGFTDVSAFVRDADPAADLTVFWRTWTGRCPPSADALDGPVLDLDAEGCAVAFHHVAEYLKARRAAAWLWNDEQARWDFCAAADLRPGMSIMLHRDVGGYSARLGWTGSKNDRLDAVDTAGPGRVLLDDQRTETGYWAKLEVHLGDARARAEQLCDALGLTEMDSSLNRFRQAVIEAAGFHDLGKAHPKWQAALPSGEALGVGPWAKCPRVLGIDVRDEAMSEGLERAVVNLRASALRLAPESRQRNQKKVWRLRWAVDQKLSREELDSLKSHNTVLWAGHVPFRPGMRHEAASALAMWKRYRDGKAPYPALAVYLAAAHHGKVRTVMRTMSRDGDDVFGVERDSEALLLDGSAYPLNFAVAADGATGEWIENEFVLTDYGWTGIVADLLGPWRNSHEDCTMVGAVPNPEPRQLGPFVLAWLEGLVRIADWRASESPSMHITPGKVKSGV